MIFTFDQWLTAHDIDCESLTRELRAALFTQYEAETSQPSEQVVLTDDEVWPHAVRQEAP